MSVQTVDVFGERELVELLAEEPKLLAFADAIAQTQTRRRRFWPARVAFSAAAVAAIAALVLAAPWNSGGGPSLVQRALAAVGDGPVIHAVIESDTGLTSIDLATGRETPVAGTLEIWFDQQRRVEHTLRRIDGRITDDMLQTPTGTVSLVGVNRAIPAPSLDPALAKSVDGYRRALAGGEAKPAGDGTIDGRAVSWLQLATPDGGSERIALDKQTSEPMRVESTSPDGARWNYNVISIESLPEGSGDFTPPKQATGPQPQAFMREPSPITAAQATRIVPGARDLGPSFENLALTQVLRAKLSTTFEPDAKTEPVVSSGVEFEYGSDNLRDGRPFVWLEEAAQPQPVYGWRPGLLPRHGHLLVLGNSGLTLVGTSGLLNRNDVYVTVVASSRELLLDAARALAAGS